MSASPGTPSAFCPNCGAPALPGTKFCTKCGVSFESGRRAATPPPPLAPASPPAPPRFRVGFRIPKLPLIAGVLVIVAALGVRFWTGGGLPSFPGVAGLPGSGGASSTPVPGLKGTMKLDPPVEVARQSIGPTGGTITVGANGGPAAGLTITVPQGAYDAPRDFRVSYQNIASQTYGSAIKPVGPMVVVENGGGYAKQNIQVRIPAKVEPGQFAMAFFFDEKTNALEGMPLVEEAADHITVMTRHFSTFFPTATAEAVLLDGKFDTGFLPGRDDWEFINNGSYIEPGGHCAGQSISAMWYFYAKRRLDPGANPPLFGRFDNNGKDPKSPKIDEDDSQAYRLASVVQHDLDFGSWSRNWLIEFSKVDDRLTYLAFSYALMVTGHPQYVGLRANDGGHAIIAYRVENRTIYVADPNAPGASDRRIVLKDGKFEAFNSHLRASDPPMLFPFIRYIASSATVDWKKMETRWGEMVAGNAGNDSFIKVDLFYYPKKADGTYQTNPVPLPERLEIPDMELWAVPNAGTAIKILNGDQWLLGPDGKNPLWSQNKIALVPGENRIGFNTRAKPTADAAFEYVDFRWVTVIAGPKVTVLPNPANAEPNKEIQFRGDLPNGPKEARWEWDFGDGTKLNDGGVAPKHAYAKTGSYSVRVTVFDVPKKAAVAGGSAKAEIADAPKGGGWVLVRTTTSGETKPPNGGSFKAEADSIEAISHDLAYPGRPDCVTKLTWSGIPQVVPLGGKAQLHMEGVSTVKGSSECYWASFTSGTVRSDYVPDGTTWIFGLTPAANFSPWPGTGTRARDPIALFPDHVLFKTRAELDLRVGVRDEYNSVIVIYTYEYRP